MSSTLSSQALALHEKHPKGKLEITPTKPLNTPEDLSLAYSPGVAAPVLAIAENEDDAYRYTNKGNLVAVISNGTAILGLGNRGALASKPVMEGKAVLFKRFGKVDAIDIEIATEDPHEMIAIIEKIAVSFGGINLEDIKAPECFMIEEELQKRLSIPVFHDDQHGTAIVACAGLLNALDIAGKDRKSVHIVINGAGSAGIAIAKMLLTLGIEKEQIILLDSIGVIYQGREEGMNSYKAMFAQQTSHRTLAESLVNADVFLGLSKADCLTPEMLASMNENPIVFAMANPNPEIHPDLAKATRSDVILATGRSDFPNQLNNLLCFPFLFRGALDARATRITPAMKRAACEALATLAREPVSQAVCDLYHVPSLSFGREYLLPKPFDERLLERIGSAVAKAWQEEDM